MGKKNEKGPEIQAKSPPTEDSTEEREVGLEKENGEELWVDGPTEALPFSHLDQKVESGASREENSPRKLRWGWEAIP